MRRLLALFAKVPVAGQVKTRLCPPLTPQAAADLYTAMLADILDQHAADDLDLALWFAPPEGHDAMVAIAPPPYRLIPQDGPDLAARMARLFRQHLGEEGYDAVVLRGTDSPTLPADRVSGAFEALAEGQELVVCPDRDGGYNLIGLAQPCDAIFELEMSHASVLEQTLEAARALGLRTRVLEAHHDVDTAADLDLLEGEVLEPDCPRTTAWLRANAW